MQLKTIEVRNFRCLKNVTIPFHELTVLIGENDAGKSTVLAYGLVPETKSGIEAFKTILNLINVNLLKSMQLIGFDYKETIGRPLTQLCARSIENLGRPKNQPKPQLKK